MTASNLNNESLRTTFHPPISVTFKRMEAIASFSFLAALSVLPFAKAGFEILFALTVFFWILTKATARGSICTDRVFFAVASLLLISSSVSAFGSGYPETSFRGVIKLLKYVLVMLVAMDSFADTNSLKRLFIVGLFGFGLVISDSFIQNMLGRDLILHHPIQYANERIRLTGPYSSYGLLAAHIIATLPILVAFLLRKKANFGVKEIGAGILLLAGFYILYGTQSRGAWLAALASFLIFGVLIRKKWFLILLLAGGFALPFAIPRKILFHFDTFHREQSLTERSLLWRRAISVIKAKPWFGCGINTYIKNYSKYTQGKEWSAMKEEAAKNEYAHFGEKESWRIPGHPNQITDYYVHNGYLQLAAETGLVSLALFLILIGGAFRAGYRVLKYGGGEDRIFSAALIASFSALLIQAAVDTTLHNLQSAIMIWFFLGLLMAMGRTLHLGRAER